MPTKKPKKIETLAAEAISVFIENRLVGLARLNNEKKFDIENGHNPSWNATLAIRANIGKIVSEAMIASGFETVCRNGNVKITRCLPKEGAMHQEPFIDRRLVERSKFDRIDIPWSVDRKTLAIHMIEMSGNFQVFVKSKKKVKSLIVEKKEITFVQLWSCAEYIAKHPAEIFTINDDGIITWVQTGSKKLI